MKHEKYFSELLKEQFELYLKCSRFDPYICSLYLHLLKMLLIKSPDGLDYLYHELDKEFDDLFYTFHKGFRSWDTFSGYDIQIQIEAPKLTKEQAERHKFLRDKLKRDNLPKDWLNDAQYKEWYSEKAKLDYIWYDDGKRSLGGHLDMIFWNLIHTDNGVMYKTLKAVVTELKEQKELQHD
jgi:hypothetical protein